MVVTFRGLYLEGLCGQNGEIWSFSYSDREPWRFVHKKVTQSDMSFRKIPLTVVCVEGRLEAEGDE